MIQVIQEEVRRRLKLLLEDNKGPVVVHDENTEFSEIYLRVTLFGHKVTDFSGQLTDAVYWAERTKERLESDLRERLMKHGYYKREE